MLAQLSPRSFLSGALVDLGTAMSAYNCREFHHVYPKAYLATQGIQFHESNVIANVCFLSASDNRTISDTAPATYMGNMDETLKPSIAASSLLPLDAMDGAKPYADFISRRAEMLAEAALKLVETAEI
jgi:hypothetical protein